MVVGKPRFPLPPHPLCFCRETQVAPHPILLDVGSPSRNFLMKNFNKLFFIYDIFIEYIHYNMCGEIYVFLTKKTTKNFIKIHQTQRDGVVGENLVSLQKQLYKNPSNPTGWGGRGNQLVSLQK
jgi:hypothetical protein